MSIANGSAATAADTNAMVTTALGLVQDDNEQLPGAYELHLQFRGTVASSTDAYARYVFVCPFDCFVETFAVSSGDQTAASTLIGAITGDGTHVSDLADTASVTEENQIVFWATKVSGAAGAGATKLARLLFDGTKTKQGLNFATTNRAHRTILKGSTLTVSVATTSINAPSLITVALVLREMLARE